MDSDKMKALQKYLDHKVKVEGAPRKKKKSKSRRNAGNVVIVDDDVDLRNLKTEVEEIEDEEDDILVVETDRRHKWKAVEEKERREDRSVPTQDRHDSGSDLSPPRSNLGKDHREQTNEGQAKSAISLNSDSDLSPPRKPQIPEEAIRCSKKRSIPSRPIKEEEDSDQSPPRKHPRGGSPANTRAVGGIQTLDHFREEAKLRKQRDRETLLELGDENSGRFAEAVHRDRKTGRRRDLEKEREEEEAKARRDAALKEKYDRWGRGVKQMEERRTRQEEETAEMSKPLARYRDDADLENMLRGKARDGDPMAAFLCKNQEKTKGKKSRPTYRGSLPPLNRFNIPPGYRWDGVDRSNGYEAKLLIARSNKSAQDSEAYQWAVQDM